MQHLVGLVGILLVLSAVAFWWFTRLRRQKEERAARNLESPRVRQTAENLSLLSAERARIAQDLHDEIGSSLTEISMLGARVRVTPEAAVFVPGGGFVYHGRIDNRHHDLGVARPEATSRDLREALAAVLSGKPVAPASAPAIGCYIPNLI